MPENNSHADHAAAANSDAATDAEFEDYAAAVREDNAAHALNGGMEGLLVEDEDAMEICEDVRDAYADAVECDGGEWD